MIIKEFNNLEEIQKYYIEEINTYVFKEDGEDIEFSLYLSLKDGGINRKRT